MVNVGKSTLISILIQVAKEHGKHVTLVVNDKGSVLTTIRQLHETGIRAIPILGANNQMDHAERLEHLERRPLWKSDHPSVRYLGSACLLLDSGSYGIGGEPCFSLYREVDGKQRRHACPFIEICPRFRVERELPQADVWVTTVEALALRRLRSRSEEWLLSEVVSRYSDIMIVDEIDAMQERAEDIFSEAAVLEGKRGQSRLGGVITRTQQVVREQEMLPVAVDDVRRFTGALRRADAALEVLYHWLVPQTNSHLRFTSWSELRRLASILSGWDPEGQPQDEQTPESAEYQRLLTLFMDFLEDTFGEGSTLDAVDADETVRPELQELQDLARRIAEEPGVDYRKLLRAWVLRHTTSALAEAQVSKVVENAFLALVSARLERAIKDARTYGRVVADLLELKEEYVDVLPRRITGYDGVIPEPPTGALFEFQFVRNRGSGYGYQSGILRYTQLTANGRSFLLSFPELYRRLDGVVGPHVLALSGTSWAPGSVRHHVQQEPQGLIAPAAGTQTSLRFHCRIWTPEGGPIRVSGLGRERSLGAIRDLTTALVVRRGADGLSEVERERNRLSTGEFAHRARVALLVNSYEQSDTVFDLIRFSRPDLLRHTRVLIRDSDDRSRYGECAVQRNKVSELPEDEDAWLLIANIPAFGRGHNVVLRDGQAAFASAYFLVRPMPIPDDPERNASDLNGFALDYVQKASPAPMEEAITKFRRACWAHYADVWNTVPYLSAMEEDDQAKLYWYLTVIHQQTAGRFVRGNTPAFLYFCDAAYLPRANLADTRNRGSVLLGMRNLLKDYIEGKKGETPRRLAAALYGEFYKGLCELGEMQDGG